ncbi:MAG TPA: HAD family hydrolase [Pirellulales bacterium]|nr:HAD family hydrolase [Pirellulales bacterium]
MIHGVDRNAVIVFDLDDTLYPEHDFVASGFQAVDEELRRRSIQGFFSTAQKLFQGGLRGTVIDVALAQLGVETTPKLIAELVEIYRSHNPRLQLFPDARWVLEHFGTTTKMGLLTDGFGRTQRNKVRALGLDSRFTATMYTDDLGPEQRKPSLVPFQKIAGALGMQDEPQCLVYVADNPKKDFIAPNQLGWLTIRIQRGSGEYSALEPVEKNHAAKCEIHTLEQLPNILNS